MSWDENSPSGRGPAGQAVRSGQPVIVHDLRKSNDLGDWTQRMLDNGFHGVICLPLRAQDKTFGLLYLYAPEILHISPQETALLQDLANDLAFGITSLRAHKAQQRILDSVIKVAAAVSATMGKAKLLGLVVDKQETAITQAPTIVVELSNE